MSEQPKTLRQIEDEAVGFRAKSTEHFTKKKELTDGALELGIREAQKEDVRKLRQAEMTDDIADYQAEGDHAAAQALKDREVAQKEQAQTKHSDMIAEIGELVVRAGNEYAEAKSVDKESARHYHAHESEYHQIATIDAHMNGVAINVEQPIVAGQQIEVHQPENPQQ